VTGRPDWLLSVDFQSGHDTVAKLPDLLLYNSALFKRHGLPVRSLLVLLHREADSPQVTGLYERSFPGEPFDVALRYRTVRVWQVPSQRWLGGGLGLVPLAPLGEVRRDELPAIIGRMKRRFDQEPPRLAAELWSAAYILMGLRYERALVQRLLQGVIHMKESVTYQAILEEGLKEGLTEGKLKGKIEGKIEEARNILLLQGHSRFGPPPSDAVAAINALTDVRKLEQLYGALASGEQLARAAGRQRFRPPRPWAEEEVLNR
jgi:hypothetical protein